MNPLVRAVIVYSGDLEDYVAEHIARGALLRVLEDCPPFDGYSSTIRAVATQPPTLQALVTRFTSERVGDERTTRAPKGVRAPAEDADRADARK